MSQQYDNTLRGALFVNDRKERDNQPDYKGSLEDDTGRQFWVSAWIKQTRSGDDYISLALTPKDESQSPAPRNSRPVQAGSSAQDFLARNRDKIDKHKDAAPSRPSQPPQDFDSFDDDIPF